MRVRRVYLNHRCFYESVSDATAACYCSLVYSNERGKIVMHSFACTWRNWNFSSYVSSWEHCIFMGRSPPHETMVVVNGNRPIFRCTAKPRCVPSFTREPGGKTDETNHARAISPHRISWQKLKLYMSGSIPSHSISLGRSAGGSIRWLSRPPVCRKRQQEVPAMTFRAHAGDLPERQAVKIDRNPGGNAAEWVLMFSEAVDWDLNTVALKSTKQHSWYPLVIDGRYFYSDNRPHFQNDLTNDSMKATLDLPGRYRIRTHEMQGIFGVWNHIVPQTVMLQKSVTEDLESATAEIMDGKVM